MKSSVARMCVRVTCACLGTACSKDVSNFVASREHYGHVCVPDDVDLNFENQFGFVISGTSI